VNDLIECKYREIEKKEGDEDWVICKHPTQGTYGRVLIDGMKDCKTCNLMHFNNYKLKEIALTVNQYFSSKHYHMATELMVDKIKEYHKIYTTRDDEKSEMWMYNEGIYTPQGRCYIKEFCRTILGTSYTTQRSTQVISKMEVDTYIDQKDFFKESYPGEIAVQNGILNLESKKLTPFNDNKIFFNKLPMKYNPEAKCPNIQQFFRDVLMNEKEIKVIQELFGFLLYKEYFLEKAFMFLGDGRNGKGKTIDLMKRFLGVDNCVEIPLDDLERDLFALGEVFQKMANLCGDLSKTALKNTGNFKKLTGRDYVSAPRKFKTRVSFTNYAKMVFSCNDLPLTYDVTPAFFNRWITLDFPYVFLPQEEIDKAEDKTNLKLRDPNIIERIATPQELSGLLNWALEGLKRLKENKSFSYSPSTEETKRKWVRKSDSFVAFVMDNIKECDNELYITKSDLRKAYAKYCKKHKLKSSSDKAIRTVFANMLGVGDARKNISGQQVAIWEGIQFKGSKVSEDISDYKEKEVVCEKIENED